MQSALKATSRPDPAVDSDWWRGAVIYQIYPRSYQDSDGDGIGDLKGIVSRLPYIASLGVDAIWISPFFKSPMKDFGYDVSDYCDVDPMFGTLADFDALTAEAHRLGLKVMIDEVLSHTADIHPWFKESRSSRSNPKADWYVWADARPDGTPPNNWLSIFGGSAWQWDTSRQQYYMHNFLAEQPDLNFHNREVQNALLDVTRFWLERGGEVLLVRRPARGLLGGMRALPTGPWREERPGLEDAPVAVGWRLLDATVSHVFTHFALELALAVADADAHTRPASGEYWPVTEIDSAGLPTVFAKAAGAIRGELCG